MILKIRFRIAVRYKQTAAVLHADRKQATGSALPVCDQKILSSTSVSPFMPRKKTFGGWGFAPDLEYVAQITPRPLLFKERRDKRNVTQGRKADRRRGAQGRIGKGN